MKFDRKLLEFIDGIVYYDGIKLKITQSMVQDYVSQTEGSVESIVMHYYKKELGQIRDKQLEQILNDREGQNRVD